MIFNLMKPVPTTEQTATMYSYNGTVLPALPDWDKEKYPYVAITNDGGTKYPKYGTTLIVSDKPIFAGIKIWDGSLYWCSETPINGMRFSIWLEEYWTLENEFEVTEKSTTEGIEEYYYVTMSKYALWGDYDILNADGTVYLSASEPIPIYE